jgi:hypothetical protein
MVSLIDSLWHPASWFRGRRSHSANTLVDRSVWAQRGHLAESQLGDAHLALLGGLLRATEGELLLCLQSLCLNLAIQLHSMLVVAASTGTAVDGTYPLQRVLR